MFEVAAIFSTQHLDHPSGKRLEEIKSSNILCKFFGETRKILGFKHPCPRNLIQQMIIPPENYLNKYCLENKFLNTNFNYISKC